MNIDKYISSELYVIHTSCKIETLSKMNSMLMDTCNFHERIPIMEQINQSIAIPLTISIENEKL